MISDAWAVFLRLFLVGFMTGFAIYLISYPTGSSKIRQFLERFS